MSLLQYTPREHTPRPRVCTPREHTPREHTPRVCTPRDYTPRVCTPRVCSCSSSHHQFVENRLKIYCTLPPRWTASGLGVNVGVGVRVCVRVCLCVCVCMNPEHANMTQQSVRFLRQRGRRQVLGCSTASSSSSTLARFLCGFGYHG